MPCPADQTAAEFRVEPHWVLLPRKRPSNEAHWQVNRWYRQLATCTTIPATQTEIDFIYQLNATWKSTLHYKTFTVQNIEIHRLVQRWKAGKICGKEKQNKKMLSYLRNVYKIDKNPKPLADRPLLLKTEYTIRKWWLMAKKCRIGRVMSAKVHSWPYWLPPADFSQYNIYGTGAH